MSLHTAATHHHAADQGRCSETGGTSPYRHGLPTVLGPAGSAAPTLSSAARSFKPGNVWHQLQQAIAPHRHRPTARNRPGTKAVVISMAAALPTTTGTPSLTPVGPVGVITDSTHAANENWQSARQECGDTAMIAAADDDANQEGGSFEDAPPTTAGGLPTASTDAGPLSARRQWQPAAPNPPTRTFTGA